MLSSPCYMFSFFLCFAPGCSPHVITRSLSPHVGLDVPRVVCKCTFWRLRTKYDTSARFPHIMTCTRSQCFALNARPGPARLLEKWARSCLKAWMRARAPNVLHAARLGCCRHAADWAVSQVWLRGDRDVGHGTLGCRRHIRTTVKDLKDKMRNKMELGTPWSDRVWLSNSSTYYLKGP